MSEMLKKRELLNFQVASSTIDAGAKIYAGRVDAVHKETYRVLGGLGRGAAQDSDDEEAVQEEPQAEIEPDRTKPDGDVEAEKKKKKKVFASISYLFSYFLFFPLTPNSFLNLFSQTARKKNVIVKNPDRIRIKSFWARFEVCLTI